MGGRGWRGSSLDTWPHRRFCIFPVSVFHFINRKKHFISRKKHFWAANVKVLNFCVLSSPALGSWLCWFDSQPLCPHLLSLFCCLGSSEGCCNWAAVPHTLHSGGSWCPALWHRDRTCPGQLASHTGLVPPKAGQGGGILNPNVWWELVNWFCKLLVRDQQTHPRLPFATFIWQNTEISLQLCQLLANTAGATLKCAGQMCFAASYPLYSFFSKIILLHEADTLGCLKLPSKGSMEAFPLQFWGSFSCRALQCLAPWLLHFVTCVWRSSKACYCDRKYWIAWGIEVVSLQ